LRFPIRPSVGDSFQSPHATGASATATVPRICLPAAIGQSAANTNDTRNPDVGTARAFCLADNSQSKTGRMNSGFRTASTPAKPSCAHARHARTCGRSAYLKTVPNPPHPATTRCHQRSTHPPTQSWLPTADRETSANQNLSGLSTPARHSPPEIREPPRVHSACAAIAISVRTPAPKFFDFREP
jgi:hypothetical protein